MWKEPASNLLASRNLSAAAPFPTVAYSPRHKLTLDLRWQPTDALSLGLNLLHVQDQVCDSRTGTAQQGRLPDYTLVGLQASWRWQALQLGVRVDNAFDKPYATSYGFWQPGRTGSLRVQAAF